MARRGLSLAAGYATSLIGGVGALVLYAHVLGPADYGRLAVYLALVEAIQGVLFQWHRLAVVKFWAINEDADIASYLATNHLVWAGIACMVLIVGLAIMAVGGRPSTEWLAAAAMGVGKSAALYAQELARASGAGLRYAVGSLLLTLVSAGAGCVVYRETHSITGILIASTIVFFGTAVLCGWGGGKAGLRGGFRQGHFRAMLRYGLPLIPVFVATVAMTRLDRPILAQFEPARVVGIYAAAATLVANVISAACLLVVTPAYPWLLREKERRTASDYRRLHVQTGLLMLGGVLAVSTALYCARGAAMPLLLGRDIGSAAQPYVLPLLAIGVLGSFRAHFFDQAYHLFSKTRTLMALNLATLVIAVSALYVGARVDGLSGLLIGLAVANGLSLLLSAAFSRSFVSLRQLVRGVGLLFMVSLVAGVAGGFAVDIGWLRVLDDQLPGIAAAGIAAAVFAGGMYLANIGALRTMLSRRL